MNARPIVQDDPVEVHVQIDHLLRSIPCAVFLMESGSIEDAYVTVGDITMMPDSAGDTTLQFLSGIVP